MIKFRFQTYDRLKRYFLLILMVVNTVCFNNSCKNYHDNSRKIEDSILNNYVDGVVFGDKDAPIKIFFFGNYECKHCRKFLKDDLQPLLNDFEGKIKVLFKLIPSSSFIEEIEVFKMALAVNEYGNYEAFNKLLLKEDRIYYTRDYKEYMMQIMQYNNAIAEYYYSDKPMDIISKDIELYKELNLQGTPAYIIGNTLYYGYASKHKLKTYIKNFKK